MFLHHLPPAPAGALFRGPVAPLLRADQQGQGHPLGGPPGDDLVPAGQHGGEERLALGTALLQELGGDGGETCDGEAEFRRDGK